MASGHGFSQSVLPERSTTNPYGASALLMSSLAVCQSPLAAATTFTVSETNGMPVPSHALTVIRPVFPAASSPALSLATSAGSLTRPCTRFTPLPAYLSSSPADVGLSTIVVPDLPAVAVNVVRAIAVIDDSTAGSSAFLFIGSPIHPALPKSAVGLRLADKRGPKTGLRFQDAHSGDGGPPPLLSLETAVLRRCEQ